ncbi:MAG: hypothetical protein KDD51_09070 [Bdellovibrionales bacterium]|nr:hypothetical protein [Bdellovibrionales bacterium]
MASITNLTEEELAFSEIIGDLIEQWGFKRHLGRIWSLLYLSSAPLNPTEIQERLALSAGSVSSALGELQIWGVVKRIRIAGDRNFYFEADVHIWRSISTVLHTRELRILEEAEASLGVLQKSLGASGNEENAKFQSGRVKHVKDAVETAHALFSQLFISHSPSLPRVGKLFKRLKTL